MSGTIVSPVVALPSSVTDPNGAALYQDIARMHAELEDLERRILRRQLCEPDEVAAPFEDRAGSLVDRVVSSLLEAGRSDIRAAARQSDLHAEVVVYEARRRAEATLAPARRDLAEVLDGRANGVDALKALGLEVSFLSDPEPIAAVVEPPVAAPAAVPWELEPVADLTEHSAAIAVEAARTDAAFDVWMSVAPLPMPMPTAVADARPSAELVPIDSAGRARARWAGSLEVLAALIGATGVLVLVLLLVG